VKSLLVLACFLLCVLFSLLFKTRFLLLLVVGDCVDLFLLTIPDFFCSALLLKQVLSLLVLTGFFVLAILLFSL